MRFNEILKTWHDDRGFGFIAPMQGGQELFVHIKDFPSGTRYRLTLRSAMHVQTPFR